jgi:hypothetical protein
MAGNNCRWKAANQSKNWGIRRIGRIKISFIYNVKSKQQIGIKMEGNNPRNLHFISIKICVWCIQYILMKIVFQGRFKMFLCFWRNSPQGARDSSLTRFLDHTQQRTTFGRLLWMSDQLVTETCTWQHTTLITDKHPCLRGGFELTISAGDLFHTMRQDLYMRREFINPYPANVENRVSS